MEKKYIISLSVLVALIIVYILLKDRIHEFFRGVSSGENTFDNQNNNNVLDSSKLLSISMKSVKSEEVSELQRILNNKGASLKVDGFFGSLTESALIKYYGVKSITLKDAKNVGIANQKVVEYGNVSLVEQNTNSSKVIEYQILENPINRPIDFDRDRMYIETQSYTEIM